MSRGSPTKTIGKRGVLLPLVSIRNPETLAAPRCCAHSRKGGSDSLTPVHNCDEPPGLPFKFFSTRG